MFWVEICPTGFSLRSSRNDFEWNRMGPERKAVVGFARRFRPTDAGANVGNRSELWAPQKAWGQDLRYPTSREKRARWRHPALVAGIEPKLAC
jgi:hypothetical protein